MTGRQSTSLRPLAWMLGGAVAFAVMGALTHGLSGRADWALVAEVRAVFMVSAAVLMARAAGVRLTIWEPPTLWWRSLAGSFSLVCNFYALNRMPVADALTLSSLYPLWIVLLTGWLVHLPPTRSEVLGVTAGLAGVVLIERPGLGPPPETLPIVLALLSSVATAFAMLGLNRLRGVDSRAVVAHFGGVASLVMLCCLLTRPQALGTSLLVGETPWMLAGVGVAGTIGQVCLTRAYATGAPARVAGVGLTQVIIALGFDVWIWGHRLDFLDVLGFALVLAPTAWLSARAARKLGQARRLARSTPAPGPQPEAEFP